MKILIVDDETVSRTKLEAILEEFGQCRTVAGGLEAVSEVEKAMIANEPYDLITMDIAMPEMDGTEALFHIRNLEQKYGSPDRSKARIIMVTAQKDRDSLVTCVQAGCDDYIIKPFDPDLVQQRLLALKLPGMEQWAEKREKQAVSDVECRETDKVAIGREVLTFFKRGEITLPSPPGVYLKFKKMVEQGADLVVITDILKEDLGVSFHLISVSNSPYYRGVKENRTLKEAIGRLGLDLTTKYVDILSNRSVFTTANQAYQPFMESVWEHSLACAMAAETLTRYLGINLGHDPFTLGLLHDVGKMVLIQILGEVEARGKIECNVDRAEILNTLAAYHGPFGQAVLDQWNFPKVFGLIAKWHDNLDEGPTASQALMVVQLSNMISKSMGYGHDQPVPYPLVDNPPAKKLGVKEDTVEKVKKDLFELMEETREALA